MPNLALMKLSAYHKARGDQVYLNRGPSPDKVYMSSVFSWNAPRARGIAKMFSCPVEAGGAGFNQNVTLPFGIEHMMPDYSLYGLDYSMGFTSRGCSRACEFCNVFKLEGPIREHARIEEFLHPNHKKLLLLDNNILMSPRWKEKLTFLVEKSLKVSICQGFDARLISKEAASLIAELRCFDWHFKYPSYYVAWDRIRDEASVLSGIQNLLDAGIKARYIRPYVLVGFNTNLEEDLYRFNKLRELGVYPFVMSYNNRAHPLKRWGQRPVLYKSVPFLEYDPKIEPH